MIAGRWGVGQRHVAHVLHEIQVEPRHGESGRPRNGRVGLLSRTARALMCGVVSALMVGAIGCNTYQVIPSSLEPKVRRALTYQDLKVSPSTYQGEIVVLGGEVIDVALEDGWTRIEAVALPLSEEVSPLLYKSPATGRFLAYGNGKAQSGLLMLDKGRLITVVGEVIGGTPGLVNDAPYEYPTLRILDLTAWKSVVDPQPGAGKPSRVQ